MNLNNNFVLVFFFTLVHYKSFGVDKWVLNFKSVKKEDKYTIQIEVVRRGRLNKETQKVLKQIQHIQQKRYK